jgi:hypothetical protein
MKSSHNTYYEHTGNDPDDMVSWHFYQPQEDQTHNIEIDIRDTHGVGSISGDWIVSHGYFDPLTQKCDSGYSLSWCLSVIWYWHSNNLDHPLITVWIDKKQAWQSQTNSSQRSPQRLDDLITSYFYDGSVLTPAEIKGSYSSVRQRVNYVGWPNHDSLNGRVMFVLTSEPNGTGNTWLHQYVANSTNVAFVAPHGNSLNDVTTWPENFDNTTRYSVVIYNFEWLSSVSDGECNDSKCYYMRDAHCSNFLTRAWDVDDADESDAGSGRARSGAYGTANFIAINHPWQYLGNNGYGNYPNGTYINECDYY